MSLKASRSATALTMAALTTIALAPAAGAAPGPETIPVTITNDTGSTQPVHVYILGTDTTAAPGTDNLGYVDASGVFHTWPKTGDSARVSAPDVSIPGPAAGTSKTYQMPDDISGRVYYSVGSKIDFGLVGTTTGQTGLVQPAPWNASDPTAKTLFDWVELTYNGNGGGYPGLWINSTQVDQLAIPTKVEVTSADGTKSSTGEMTSGGRQQVINTLKADPIWAKTVITAADGTVLRVLSPGHATSAGLLPENYLDRYIDSAWSSYTNRTLTITPFTDQPSVKFYGRTSGTRMTFTDTTGKVVAAFERPKTVDVWGCDGALNGAGNTVLPNDLTTGPISRTLCAGLNRGTLGTSTAEPVLDASAYYKNSDGLNLYGKAVHEAMTDGRAYAFAFDDVGNHESLVHSSSPKSVSLTMQPLTGTTVNPAPTTPTVPAPGTPDPTGTQSLSVSIASGHPGYATLNLGTGTKPGIVTIAVDGGSTSKISVGGPGSVRFDLSGSVGTHKLSVSSTAALGPASITMPDGTTSSTPTSPTPTSPTSTKTATVTIGKDHPGYATLDLGAGTTPGVLTVKVAGGSTSTVAVDGPGKVRTNLSGPLGSATVTVASTGSIGSLAVLMP